MSVDRHLILQEVVLRPSGEWAPGGRGWTIARVAEGGGYWMPVLRGSLPSAVACYGGQGATAEGGEGGQGANTRAMNTGDGLVLAASGGGQLRASQLGPLKLEFFTIQPQFLDGLLTVAEWHRLEAPPGAAAVFFAAHEPVGQKFTHIANQKRGDGLTMRCALLQLWASAVGGLLAAPAPDARHANKLRERIRQQVGHMLEIELTVSSPGELAEKLHCSKRYFGRLFREEFGMPLRARQIELRLQRARQLLADSDAKIASVAQASGFRHLGLFNSLFKKNFGMTPSVWRQKVQMTTCHLNVTKPSHVRHPARLASVS
jgi:AraC-like DNA-binding protein